MREALQDLHHQQPVHIGRLANRARVTNRRSVIPIKDR
jgi:hypothetical protein